MYCSAMQLANPRTISAGAPPPDALPVERRQWNTTPLPCNKLHRASVYGSSSRCSLETELRRCRLAEMPAIVVIVAVDASQQAEHAFDCKYTYFSDRLTRRIEGNSCEYNPHLSQHLSVFCGFSLWPFRCHSWVADDRAVWSGLYFALANKNHTIA